ncbi:MAG TPA: thioredoxin fold domain-containing protein [Sumerlaeia bacterium]|nr:thioredoxin fold domain-containing protein [Sumerlaeia bacterium]
MKAAKCILWRLSPILCSMLLLLSHAPAAGQERAGSEASPPLTVETGPVRSPSAPTDPPPPLDGWRASPDAALLEARKAGKPVVLFFTRSWTPPCAAIRNEVLVEEEVRKQMRGVEAVEIDVDKEPGLAGEYKITELPTFVVLDTSGKEYDRFTGFLPPSAFLETLRAAVDRRQAPAALEEHIRSHPKDIEARWLLARKYARDRKRDELDRTLGEIRDLDPENGKGYLDNVAFLEMMTTMNVKTPADGLRATERFLKEFPQSEYADQVALTRAHLAYQTGDKDLCVRILERFHRDYPKSPLAPQVRRDLTTLSEEIGKP